MIPTDDTMIREDLRDFSVRLIREVGGVKKLMLATVERVRPVLNAMREALGADDRTLIGTHISDAFMAMYLTGHQPRGCDEEEIDCQDGGLAFMRWALDGTPVFSLTDSLTASLVLTDPGSVPAECICWPFETFLVEIPSGYLSTRFQGQTEDVQLIQAHRFDISRTGFTEAGHMPQDNRRLIVQALQAVSRGEWRLALTYAQEHRALVQQRWAQERMASVRLYSVNGTSLFRRDHYPEGDTPIGRWYGSKRDQTTGTMVLTEEDHYATQVAARIITNLCIYIQTKVEGLTPRSVKPRRVKPGHELPPRKLRPEKHFELGHEVRLPRLVIDAARACARQGTDKATWRLMARQVVRGHTKLQRCGAKGADRKFITVAPYERYKHVLEQARKVYRVETPEERVQP